MATSINSSFDFETRKNEILQKVHFFQSKMSNPAAKIAPLTVEIRKFSKSPAAIHNNGSVGLPPWYFFKYDDIPERFRIHSLQDRRLSDERFLSDMASWINEKIRSAGLSAFCEEEDWGALQRFLELLRDPLQYEKARDFVLGHEVSHLVGSRNQGIVELLSEMQEPIATIGLIVPLFAMVLIFGLAPLLSATVFLTAFGICFAIQGVSLYFLLNPNHRSEVAEEKRADLQAAEALEDASGGIYYFNTLRQHYLMLRRSPKTSDIDAQGNNKKDKTHPPLTERIAYLTQFQQGMARA